MIKYIREQKNLKGKTVLVRTDLDEPHIGGKLLDDYRIRMSVPTIEFLHAKGAKVILLSKIGRPHRDKDAGIKSGALHSRRSFKGKEKTVKIASTESRANFDLSQTLAPAAERLGQLLNRKMVTYLDRMPDYEIRHLIFFPGDIRDPKNLQALKDAPQKDIILLENMRFYKEEELADRNFAKQLAELADIFVFDAFAMAHRQEASVSILPKFLPAYAGLNVEKELRALQTILTLKAHPFVALIGGAKVSDKVGTIRNLGKQVDHILVGGGPANLFFLAKGYEIGKSLCERSELTYAREMLRNFKDKIVLPEDVTVARPTSDSFVNIRSCSPTEVKKNEAIFDIGPRAILQFANHIKSAKKMVWSGPMGYFEKKPFSHGSLAIAELYASKCRGRAFGVVGGGDTLEVVDRAKVGSDIDFVSTAGSAMLDYLAGEKLPGVLALEK